MRSHLFKDSTGGNANCQMEYCQLSWTILAGTWQKPFGGVGAAHPLVATFPPYLGTARPAAEHKQEQGQVHLDAPLPGIDPKQQQLSLPRQTTFFGLLPGGLVRLRFSPGIEPPLSYPREQALQRFQATSRRTSRTASSWGVVCNGISLMKGIGITHLFFWFPMHRFAKGQRSSTDC